jgi:Uma2 family endonuclease
MVMLDTTKRWTAEMVRELPDDGNRYEVVHGELLVTPAPRYAHQLVLGRLHAWLRAYLDPLGLADSLVFSPADISWDEETLVQPDLFVAAQEISASWATFKTLRLAVEVVSPSSARADRVVDVWRPEDARPAVVVDVVRWRVTPDAPQFELDLATLFREVPE